MATSKRNGDSEGKYIRISGLWKNGKVLLGNNIRKRVAGDKFDDMSEDDRKDSCRFRVSNNMNKSNDFMSNDADAHLIIESKHFDELIEYLQLIKKEHDNYWSSKK